MPRSKEERVCLRVSQLEKEQMMKKATAARMTLSEYIVTLSAQKKIIIADGVSDIYTQLIKIGTNVNQIAYVANTYKSVSQKQIDLVNENLIKIQTLIGEMTDTIYNSDDEIEV